jgi:peroxiredoxin (alkyl hydroperoxide reductase subunit C)
MKKFKITAVLVLLATVTMAQRESKIPLLGQQAPAFTGESTHGTINFPDDFGKDWKIIFSHPQDFTPVCTSELLELASMQDDFKNLGVEIVVVSTDMLYIHHAWVEAMENIKLDGREQVKIDFPLVEDHNKAIAEQYGMLQDHTNSTRYVRGVYIVDPANTVRFIQFYPVEIGRNMDEIKRAIIALQTAEENDVVIPANWKPGDDVLLYHYQQQDLKDPSVKEVDWFLIYKKLASTNP